MAGHHRLAQTHGTAPIWRLAASCEYLVWGSRGPLRKDHDVYLPGLVSTEIARAKAHLAEKPLGLLAVLVQVAPVGTVVLDPFMGSGSTLVAAIRAGRLAVGVELDESYCAVAVRRLAQGVLELHGPAPAVCEALPLDDPEQGGASWVSRPTSTLPFTESASSPSCGR
jgi:hypothetical protein